MKTVSFDEMRGMFFKVNNTWGLFLTYLTGDYDKDYCDKNNIDQYDWRTVQKSVPFLNEEESFNLVAERHMWVVCDSEEDARVKFESIYGDESPNDNEKLTVNAEMYSNEGECITENS